MDQIFNLNIGDIEYIVYRVAKVYKVFFKTFEYEKGHRDRGK